MFILSIIRFVKFSYFLGFILVILLLLLMKIPLIWGQEIELGFIIELRLVSRVFLVLSWFVFIIIVFSVVIKYGTRNYIYLLGVIGLITFILIIFFIVDRILNFYILFEFSLIPIYLIVLGWGYQPERVRAGYNLLFYTVFSSIPFLVFIVLMVTGFNCLYFRQLYLYFFTIIRGFRWVKRILFIVVFRRFLVKMPMFLFHLWLPKAHVEAPVFGSIVLAGVLLKLGGFGILKFLPVLRSGVIETFLQRFRLLGGAWVRVLCLRQMDIKVLIAYSSVSHIRLVIAALLIKSNLGIVGAFMIIISHGVVSSGIFWGANLIYENSHSRNIVFNSGVLSKVPIFTLFWFLLCIGNIASPPSFNLLREIFCLLRLYSINWVSGGILGLIIFFRVGYTIILYSTTQQKKEGVARIGLFRIKISELRIFFLHGFYVYILCLSFSIFV